MKYPPIPLIVLLTVSGLTAARAGAFELIGVAWNDPVVRIDPAIGAGTPVGPAGFGALNSLAATRGGELYSASGSRLVAIDPLTGLATRVATLDFGSITPSVFGLAVSPAGILYAINSRQGSQGMPAPKDELFTINPDTGAGTLIGSTGVEGLQSLEFAPDGTLFGWEVGSGSGAGLGLVTIDPLTGATTDVNPAIGGTAAQVQGLAFGPDGVLYGARSALYSVNPASGAISLIGAGGYDNIRGLAVVPEPGVMGLLALAGLLFAGAAGCRQFL